MSATETPVYVYCEQTSTKLYRIDPLGRGVFVYCKGHHREELKTWAKLGLTPAICLQLLHKTEDNLI